MTKETQEQARYAAVSGQITQLLDDMANDRDPLAFVANIGRAWLAAEMYDLNEKSRMAHEARSLLLGLLHWRIGQVGGPVPANFEMLFSR